jgi:hypothetical protein
MATKTSAAVPAYPRRPLVTAVIAKIGVSNSWCEHSLSMQLKHYQRVSTLKGYMKIKTAPAALP